MDLTYQIQNTNSNITNYNSCTDSIFLSVYWRSILSPEHALSKIMKINLIDNTSVFRLLFICRNIWTILPIDIFMFCYFNHTCCCSGIIVHLDSFLLLYSFLSHVELKAETRGSLVAEGAGPLLRHCVCELAVSL